MEEGQPTRTDEGRRLEGLGAMTSRAFTSRSVANRTIRSTATCSMSAMILKIDQASGSNRRKKQYIREPFHLDDRTVVKVVRDVVDMLSAVSF
eukprot:695271-Hanusia_phi.AAC.1